MQYSAKSEDSALFTKGEVWQWYRSLVELLGDEGEAPEGEGHDGQEVDGEAQGHLVDVATVRNLKEHCPREDPQDEHLTRTGRKRKKSRGDREGEAKTERVRNSG